MLRILLIPAALLLLLAGAMYWSGGPIQRKADFTFISGEEIHTLDTDRMSWSQDFRIGYALWEGLYRLDPVTLEAIDGTASPIDISDDKTTYTFHIRPDAKWSNGEAVVAGDFVFSWRRLLEEPGEYTYLYHYIQGAKEYEEAFEKAAETPKLDRGRFASVEEYDAAFKKAWADQFAGVDFGNVGIKELDSRTLRVTLIHPTVPFPQICAMPPFFPMNAGAMDRFLDHELFEKSGHRVRRYDKQFTSAPYLVSNGPYLLDSWAYKRRLRLVANPYFWNRKSVVSPIVDQMVAEDPQWAYAMYDSGGADWIPEFSGEIAAELYAQHRPDVRVFPAFGTYFYSFNCQEKLNDGRPNPFSDKRVRQAFSMAIDKKVIVETITRLGEIPTTTYIPADSFKGYKTPKGLQYDIAAAKKLLADAGYPNGGGFPEVSLLFNNVPPHSQIGENIRHQWSENLGVNVKLEGVEGKTFGDRQRNHDYAVCRASWFGDYIDPSTFTDKYKPDSENNEAAWKSADYSEWCRKGDVEPDPDKRLDYYAKAETVLLDDAPILPLYTYVGCYLMRDTVSGIPLDRRTMLIMSSVGIDNGAKH